MESTGCLEWPGMHLADVRTVVTGISEVIDPALRPRVRIFEDTCGMGIVTGKQAGPGWRAGRSCYKAVGEVNPFLSESIQIGSLNMGEPQCPNGVIALLVRDDEYNVGLTHKFLRNGCRSIMNSWKLSICGYSSTQTTDNMDAAVYALNFSFTFHLISSIS